MALEFDIYGKHIEPKQAVSEKKTVSFLEELDTSNLATQAELDSLTENLNTNYFPITGGTLFGSLNIQGALAVAGQPISNRPLDFTSTQVVQPNNRYSVYTSGQSLTATLPNNPNVGDEIEFIDGTGTWDINPFFVTSIDRLIESTSGRQIRCNVKYGNFKLNFIDRNNLGWKISTLSNLVGDPHFNNVSLLLTMNGVSGSNVFRDYSSNNLSVSTSGNVIVDTAQKIVGNGSAYFSGESTYLRTQQTNVFNFGLNVPFTIEFWHYPLITTGSRQTVFTTKQFNSATGGNFDYLSFQLTLNGTYQFSSRGITIGNPTLGNLAIANTWNHVVIGYDGSSSLYFYNNGIRTINVNPLAFTPYQNTTFTIGADLLAVDGLWGEFGSFYRGYIDHFRVTRNILRYTSSTIQLPTKPYPPL